MSGYVCLCVYVYMHVCVYVCLRQINASRQARISIDPLLHLLAHTHRAFFNNQ